MDYKLNRMVVKMEIDITVSTCFLAKLNEYFKFEIAKGTQDKVSVDQFRLKFVVKGLNIDIFLDFMEHTKARANHRNTREKCLGMDINPN